MKKLTVGSCFSGIGGLEKGLEDTGGFETRWQIEIDPYATAVLKKHWPGVKRYSDIRTIDPDGLERVDLICGGYPCQPFSFAGRRCGAADQRHLWPDMLRIIRHLRPRYALMENVTGHLSMGFGRVLGDLFESGYDAEWEVLPGRAFGSPDYRERVFILAYPCGEGLPRRFDEKSLCRITEPSPAEFGDRNIACGAWWQENRANIRMGDGVPLSVCRRVVRLAGNAVKPQVAQKVGEMILSYERNRHDRQT